MGRMPEAIAENKKALELDPFSLPINHFMGMTYMFAGDYEKSYRQFQHTIAMDPTFPLAHEYFSFLLKLMGRYEEGIRDGSHLSAGPRVLFLPAEADGKIRGRNTRWIPPFRLPTSTFPSC